jgi:hypothetical protein
VPGTTVVVPSGLEHVTAGVTTIALKVEDRLTAVKGPLVSKDLSTSNSNPPNVALNFTTSGFGVQLGAPGPDTVPAKTTTPL